MAGMTSSFKLLILFWLIPCVSLKLELGKRIYFVDKRMKWEDSSQFCRSENIDLLSFLPEDEPALLGAIGVSDMAWVGLKRDPANSRPWSFLSSFI